MKTKELKKRCESYLDDLISELKTEGSEKTLLDYLRFCAAFHRYSFRNRLLIWMQKPEASWVAGFRAWQKLGRSVKKGEKGIAIFAPITVKRKPKTQAKVVDEVEEEIETTEEIDQLVTVFKVVHVFDVSQTEGKSLPQPPETLSVVGSAEKALPALESLIASYGIDLTYGDPGRHLAGVSKKGKITVLSSVADEVKFYIASHELAHELMHGQKEREMLSKKVKELEADATAYIVCRHYGLETKSPAYLALYRTEEVDIRLSLDRIVGTASKIIEGIAARIPKQKKAA